MEIISVGDRVRFRPGSPLPLDWKLPTEAIGTVRRKHIEVKSGHEWLDIDFGKEVGFLFAVDPAEFELMQDA